MSELHIGYLNILLIMKLPTYHNIRTNKNVRRLVVSAPDKVATHYHHRKCSTCHGIGKITFCPVYKQSIVSFETSHGRNIYVEQLCKDCDETTRKYCKSCSGRGYCLLVTCSSCCGSGMDIKIDSSKVKNYKSDTRRQIRKKELEKKECTSCNTRICQIHIEYKKKNHKLSKRVDDAIYYSDGE